VRRVDGVHTIATCPRCRYRTEWLTTWEAAGLGLLVTVELIGGPTLEMPSPAA
jgi:hypothetical protein